MSFFSDLSDTTITAAIDGGTTNTRVRVLRGTLALAEARRPVGARDVARSAERGPMAHAARDALSEALRSAGLNQADRLVASGMITSEVGLSAVAHVPAPAGIAELARGARLQVLGEVSDQPILLIPGVRTEAGPDPDGWTNADVMRGEECETLAVWHALATDRRPACFLWPGSHTKLVSVDDQGRILSSFTTISGELLAAIAEHSVIAASLPRELPRSLDLTWARKGAHHVRRGGLGRAAFLVRIAALGGQGTAGQRASWLIGAVAAQDVEDLLRHPSLHPEARGCVHIGGTAPLQALYRELLQERLAGPVIATDTAISASVGAALIAERWFRSAQAAGAIAPPVG